METRNGTRLRCDHCGSEIIVLKASNPVVECCGQLMDAIFVPASGGADGSPERR
jgi:ribosomal protein S27E